MVPDTNPPTRPEVLTVEFDPASDPAFPWCVIEDGAVAERHETETEAWAAIAEQQGSGS